MGDWERGGGGGAVAFRNGAGWHACTDRGGKGDEVEEGEGGRL